MIGVWLPAVLWTAVIALESTFGSAANTGPLLQQLLLWLFGEGEPAQFDTLHYALRKAGHFAGYGILGALWFRAIAWTMGTRSVIWCAGLAIAGTFLIASLDEWHQSFSPARTGSVQDVALDMSGALTLVLLAMMWVARRRNKAAAFK